MANVFIALLIIRKKKKQVSKVIVLLEIVCHAFISIIKKYTLKLFIFICISLTFKILKKTWRHFVDIDFTYIIL